MTEEQRALVVAAALEVALAWRSDGPACTSMLVDTFLAVGIDLDAILAERAECAARLPRLHEMKPPLKLKLVAIEGLK